MHPIPASEMTLPLLLATLGSLALGASGDDGRRALVEDGLHQDPYLMYQPKFARSLPVQILITAIMLTLCAILLINLLFTYSYHWPLSRLNYGLQMAGVLCSLLSFITQFHAILSEAAASSKLWPYMLNYVAVQIPPVEPYQWSPVAVAWWYGLQALASGLVHVTHIQFLTILFPSNLEAKLILALLGPLAFLSALTELIPLHEQPLAEQTSKLTDVSDSIQGICNSSLFLLYTVALCVWGFLVNRGQAWRTDGGTAAFGGAAMLLATASTVLSFLQTSEESPFIWLPGTLHTVVLWQNFAGWWWWVGAGSGNVKSASEENRRRKRKRVSSEKPSKLRLWTRQRVSLPPQEGSDGLRRVASRESVASRDTVAEGSSAAADDTRATGYTFKAFWNSIRRDHRHAVRIQTLERLAARSRRRRPGDGPFENELAADMPGDNDIPLDSLQGDMRRSSRRLEEDHLMVVSPNTPVTPEPPQSPGTGLLWWGPFSKWRLRDRTVYD